MARRPGSGVDPGALAAGLLPALDTPLGGLVDGRRLRDFTPADFRLVQTANSSTSSETVRANVVVLKSATTSLTGTSAAAAFARKGGRSTKEICP